MFHMLSCFNLEKGTTVDEFQQALLEFSVYMRKHERLHSVGKLGLRCSDTPMDTDESRSLDYYFIMSFRDRTQCDAAYEFIDNDSATHTSHSSVISKVRDAVFICWEDIPQ